MERLTTRAPRFNKARTTQKFYLVLFVLYSVILRTCLCGRNTARKRPNDVKANINGVDMERIHQEIAVNWQIRSSESAVIYCYKTKKCVVIRFTPRAKRVEQITLFTEAEG